MFPQIPGYRIDKKLGESSMAEVYLGVQEELERKVAIKILKPGLFLDEGFKKRFLDEAKKDTRFVHNNIANLLEVGEKGDLRYIVMEYLPESLKDKIRRHFESESPQEAREDSEDYAPLEILKQLVKALDYAHTHGVVHQNIRPENIRFREDGTALVVDFFIAKVLGPGTRETLRKKGIIFGSPYYRSPEQSLKKPLDGKTDMYSLGVVFYEMLTGKVPYDAPEEIAIENQHVMDSVPLLPKPLRVYQPLLGHLMAKERVNRTSGGEELVELIDGIALKLPPKKQGKSAVPKIPPIPREGIEENLEKSEITGDLEKPGMADEVEKPAITEKPGKTAIAGMMDEFGDLEMTEAPGTPGIEGLTDLAEAAGAAEIPGMPGEPGEPGIAGMMDEFGDLEMTEAPGTPGAAEIPGMPAKPGMPGEPKEPGITGMMDEFGDLEMAEAPGTPGAAEIPGMPVKPGMPGEPKEPGITGMMDEFGDLEMTEAPGTPGTQGIEGISGIPMEAEISEEMGKPGIPGESGTPEIERFSQITGAAEITGVSEIPGEPGISEKPGEPGISEMMEELGIREMPKEPEISEEMANPGIIEIPEIPEEPGITGESAIPGDRGKPNITGTRKAAIGQDEQGLTDLPGKPRFLEEPNEEEEADIPVGKRIEKLEWGIYREEVTPGKGKNKKDFLQVFKNPKVLVPVGVGVGIAVIVIIAFLMGWFGKSPASTGVSETETQQQVPVPTGESPGPSTQGQEGKPVDDDQFQHSFQLAKQFFDKGEYQKAQEKLDQVVKIKTTPETRQLAEKLSVKLAESKDHETFKQALAASAVPPLEKYLEQFPTGLHAAEAKEKLIRLKEQERRQEAEKKRLLASFIKLRSQYTDLSVEDVRKMLVARGFFEKYYNKSGDFKNHFELKAVGNDRIVIDYATGLVWHESGSADYMKWAQVQPWLDELNRKGYAGYSDWRVPTLEEAASLLESKESSGYFIDAVFSRDQSYIWTGDTFQKTRGWAIDFYGGDISKVDLRENVFVRPVRSIK